MILLWIVWLATLTLFWGLPQCCRSRRKNEQNKQNKPQVPKTPAPVGTKKTPVPPNQAALKERSVAASTTQEQSMAGSTTQEPRNDGVTNGTGMEQGQQYYPSGPGYQQPAYNPGYYPATPMATPVMTATPIVVMPPPNDELYGYGMGYGGYGGYGYRRHYGYGYGGYYNGCTLL